MGVNDCQCLAAKLVSVAMGSRGQGWVHVGHVSRAALDQLAALMGAELVPIEGKDGACFLTLDATRDGIRIYAQAYKHDGAEVAARVAAMAAGATP